MYGKLGVLVAGACLLVGCGGGGGSVVTGPVQDAQYAHDWAEEVLTCIRANGPGPTANSRAIGMMTTAMYDAYAILDDTAVAVHTKDEQLGTPIGKAKLQVAASQAAYRVLVDLFPTHQARLSQTLLRLGGNPNDQGGRFTDPIGAGNMAAENLLAERHNDGSNQLGGYADTTGYQSVNTVENLVDPNRWQPQVYVMPDGSLKKPNWLTPHWGQVKPFALSSGAEFRCEPGARVGSAEFKAQVDEVIELQADLSDKNKLTAEYWADGPASETPPGHWLLMAEHIARNNGYSQEDCIKLYFLVGNAVMDAGISAWDSKIAHDYVRPISAVKYLYAGQKIYGWAGPGKGTQLIDAKDWRPYQPLSFITPPFAELPSGHSTFSSAAAQVIRRFQGNDLLRFGQTYAPGSSHYEPGVTPKVTVQLFYGTLTSAVNAAGLSRLYGGIHFAKGNEDGLKMGRLVGDKVWFKANDLFAGRR